jgi:hypothetical protein
MSAPRRRAKALPLPAISAWREFDPPALVLVTFCPQCSNVGVAVRTHQRNFIVERRCEFCVHPPILHVIPYQRIAPAVRPPVKRRLRARARK